MRDVVIIGAASSAGAYGSGQERTPQVLRRRGLAGAIGEFRDTVLDAGDVVHAEFGEDLSSPALRNADVLRQVNATLAGKVSSVVEQGYDVLVVGGDCTVEVGVVAGARMVAERVGLAYVDLDCDLNAPATADGAGDWMGVAHMLDIPGSDPRLAQVAGAPSPLLGPDDVRLLAADNVTAAEQRTIEQHGIVRYGTDAIRRRLPSVLDELRSWAGEKDVVCLHLDVDVLDQRHFPIAENTRETAGLRFDELQALLTGLWTLPGRRVLTVCEVNPSHVDSHDRLDALIAMLAGLHVQP